MKYRKDKRYRIEWLDHSSEAAWQSIDEIKKWSSEKKSCSSEGRFCYENDSVVVLYLDEYDENYGSTTMIYKQNIIKVRRL